MRIISTFHDYYDNCMSYGTDNSLIYKRTPSQELFRDNIHPKITWEFYSGGLNVERFIVGFANRIFSVINLRWPSPVYPYDCKKIFCYDYKSFDAVLSELLTNKRKRRDFYESSVKYKSYAQEVELSFKFAEDYSILFSYECPIWMIRRDFDCLNKQTLFKNPRLSEIEFYRVMPHQMAYQELSMYLGGLATPEKLIPSIPDKDMVEIKGFDKYSFRKPSSKK